MVNESDSSVKMVGSTSIYSVNISLRNDL